MTNPNREDEKTILGEIVSYAREPTKTERRFHLGIHLCKHRGCSYHAVGCPGVEGEPCVVERFYLEKFQEQPKEAMDNAMPTILAQLMIRYHALQNYFQEQGAGRIVTNHPWIFNELRMMEASIAKHLREITKFVKDEKRSQEELIAETREWAENLASGNRKKLTKRLRDGYDSTNGARGSR